MCGLAGVALSRARSVGLSELGSMAAAVRHRGPDGYGFYSEEGIGLAHVRLSVIDPALGVQPWVSRCGDFVIAYNGEVFNYLELRSELERSGRSFRTRCDTEVVLEAFAEWGEECLQRLNGQFAFVVVDRRDRSLFLARDRYGIRPLFYSHVGSDLVFGSEVKALFASGRVARALDPVGLDQCFTFWGARPPCTPFEGVRSLRPGEWLRWRGGRSTSRSYYSLEYEPSAGEDEGALEALDDALRDSVRLRLRSDVTVGGYLSGGLDSSITCALAAPLAHELQTFSVAFDEPEFDESEFQELVATRLGTRHRVARINAGRIGAIFPKVVRHVEGPLVRTAPAPLFLLSALASDCGIKVVLTGEGADEVFWGYDLFKEVAVRRFCLRQPESRWRPLLFHRLYPYLPAQARGGAFWRRFFLDAGQPGDPLFSHLPRFRTTSRIKDFLSGDIREALNGRDALDELRDELPSHFGRWSALARAAYLEMKTLLSPYLLSAQGDRMAMAHGVEGRFPFLDHRLVELASRLPDRSKLRTLSEKDILRRWSKDVVPDRVRARKKQPYRAPDAVAFFGGERPAYLEDILRPEAIERVGVFSPASVAGLVRRCEAGRATGFRENQAIVAIVSTQLLHDQVVEARVPAPLPPIGADAIVGRAAEQTG